MSKARDEALEEALQFCQLWVWLTRVGVKQAIADSRLRNCTGMGTSDLFKLVSGVRRDDAIAVCCIVKDELFHLPAFFDHYRKLGAEQFIMLDDKSRDGTGEFLRDQQDCLVLEAQQGFGDILPSGQRAGVMWKSAIPQIFCKDRWSIYIDADELLFLPGFSDIRSLTEKLDQKNASAIGAAMIDFYPASISEFANKVPPANREAMFTRYPYFDACRHLAWKAGELRPTILNGGVRERLLREFKIEKRSYGKQATFANRVATLWKRMFSGRPNFASLHKVPLVRWIAGRSYLHSHTLNVPPDVDLILPIAHFKFTAALDSKIVSALESGAYSQGSRTYLAYRDLLTAMRQGNGSFLGKHSRRFTSVEDLYEKCCK